MRIPAALALLFLTVLPAVAVGGPEVTGASAASVSTNRAAIEGALGAMQKAVLAGDGPGYLALIDRSDPVFAKEQENWAKDLAKKKPDTFTLEIVEDTTPSAPPAPADGKDKGPEVENIGSGVATIFNDDLAQFRMKMTWRMPERKRDRVVSYPVVFGKNAAGQWVYRGERWDVVEKAADDRFNGVRICYEPGSERLKKVAGMVVNVMPAVRTAVDGQFRLKVPGVQTVKLYQSMRHLQLSIWLSYEDSLGGWNEPGESIKILPDRSAAESNLKPLLAHEYGHVATFCLGPKATDAPWWALEGAADLAGSEFRSNARRRRDRTVRRWAQNDNLPDWAVLTPFPLPEKDAGYMANVYTQGEHMLVWITDRFGAEARIAFLKELCCGKTAEEASRAALGLEWREVDTAWRASISGPASGVDDDKAP